jgi:ketosteroid isomerase-like protein
MKSSEASVKQILDIYKQAVYNKDVDAFIRLYDANVRVFDTWGVWSYEDANAWRKMAEGWLSSLGDERVRVTFDDVQVIGDESIVTASAVTSYAELSAEGQELSAMQNRLSWVLKSIDGEWKIVHEHTSAPVGFDDGKVILKREKSN